MLTSHASVPKRHALPLQKWKTVLLASLGSSLEMYDFIIYGVFAREIASQFFPASDPVAALIGTFGVFAVGYLSRPLGAIMLGSFGDRYGRRVVFLVSVFAMSAATIAIGLLPGYAVAGLAAPAMLVTLRLAQGFFLAGELPCAITYVVEEMPQQAGLVSGLVVFCLNTGVFIATLTSLVIHYALSPVDVQIYGWRIAFAFGGVIGLVSYGLRRSLHETEEFSRMRTHVSKRPFRALLRTYPVAVAIGVGTAGIVNASNILLFVFLPSYLTNTLHYETNAVGLGQNLGIVAMSASILLSAGFSRHCPSRIIHRTGALLMMLGGYPLYVALAEHTIDLWLAFLLIGFTGGLVCGTYAYLLADLFPTPVRFSGVALSLNASTVVFTGLTPIIVTGLMRASGMLAAPGLYLAAIALLANCAGLALGSHGGRLRHENTC